jgi:hypothetical protein
MEDLTAIRLLPMFVSIESQEVDLSARIDTVLNQIVGLGFHSARFYQLSTSDSPSPESSFVLTNYAYASGGFESVRGLTIKLAETTIFQTGNLETGYSVHLSSSDLPKADAVWSNVLGIDHTNWIDLAIKAPIEKNKVVALLALSWTGAAKLVSNETISSLRLLVSCFSSALVVPNSFDAAAQIFREENFPDSYDSFDAAHSFLSELSEYVRATTSASSCAVFAYNAENDMIEKKAEAWAKNAPQVSFYPETYETDRFLSGKAFLNQDYRFVPDLERLLTSKRDLISEPNFTNHETAIGKLNSIQYGVCGQYSNRIFFRVCRNDSETRFTNRERDILKAICAKVGTILDSLLLKRQLTADGSIARHASVTNGEVEIEKACIKEAIKALGFESFLVCYKSAEADSWADGFGGGWLSNVNDTLGSDSNAKLKKKAQVA